MGLCAMRIISEEELPEGNSPGEFDGGIYWRELSCYLSTVLCDWSSSLVSRREKILKEEIDTLKETNVITTICSENGYKNKGNQLL